MRRTSSKRLGPDLSHLETMKKPYGFCCDAKVYDPQMSYNQRKPPFPSSMSNIALQSGGPDLKFHFQDVGPPPFPIQFGEAKAKGAAYLGDCKRCRGPLEWFLEDEIETARDMLANEKKTKKKVESDKNLAIAKIKEKKRRELKKKQSRKLKKESSKNSAITNESQDN